MTVPPFSGGSPSKVDRWLNALRRRWLTPGGNQCSLSIPLAATTITIQLQNTMATTTYGVLLSTNWNTTTWVSLKGANACNVNFGTAAPANATLDIAVFDTETR